MVWLVQARNHIEKEGDLETYSSARVVLLADWHNSQPLVELQVPPLATTQEILSKLPELRLPTYALQEGLLEIERRWVVRDLPDKELLEVLAHCYGVLATLVGSAHHQCGFGMWTFCSDSHEARPVRTEHLEGQLPCMVTTREMRMVRLHLERGAFATPVRLQVPADPARKDAVLARYESEAGDLAIRQGEDVIAASARWVARAKRVLVTDGEHLHFPNHEITHSMSMGSSSMASPALARACGRCFQGHTSAIVSATRSTSSSGN
jgi:hypothetical protein